MKIRRENAAKSVEREKEFWVKYHEDWQNQNMAEESKKVAKHQVKL